MSRLAIVGLTARDRVDGAAPATGGVPYYCTKALAEVDGRALVVTRVAESDVALLDPLRDTPHEVVWRPAPETAAYTLNHDAETGERHVAVTSLGEPWTPAALEEWVMPAIAGSSTIHAGALSAADFPNQSLALLARDHRLSFDAQGLVRPGRIGPVVMEPPRSLDALAHVDVLKLSLEEAAVMGVEPTVVSLAALGVPEVVLTAGSRGAWIYAHGALVEVTSDPIAVRDATGAGDGFIACYLHARLEGATAADAGALAARAVTAMLRRRKAATE